VEGRHAWGPLAFSSNSDLLLRAPARRSELLRIPSGSECPKTHALLESDPHTEAQYALIDAVTADAAGLGDRRKAAQILHRAFGIQLQIGYIRRRINEVGRVAEIESLCGTGRSFFQ
jgi:hypothetical protein